MFQFYYRPRSVASEGYVFTGVCHSFCSTPDQATTPPSPPSPPQDETRLQQHLPAPPQDETRLQHRPPPRDYAQAGGTHPTGMNSC